jgi:hypothetical protein
MDKFHFGGGYNYQHTTLTINCCYGIYAKFTNIITLNSIKIFQNILMEKNYICSCSQLET